MSLKNTSLDKSCNFCTSDHDTNQPNGFKLVFPEVTYRLYPNSFEDFYSWSNAFHKAAVILGKSEVCFWKLSIFIMTLREALGRLPLNIKRKLLDFEACVLVGWLVNTLASQPIRKCALTLAPPL